MLLSLKEKETAVNGRCHCLCDVVGDSHTTFTRMFVGKIRIIPLKETNFIGASDTRTSTHGIASISMHTHSYITRAVAAMDSCFTLIRVHQHDIAVRPLYGQSRFQRLLGPKALYVQNSKELKP